MSRMALYRDGMIMARDHAVELTDILIRIAVSHNQSDMPFEMLLDLRRAIAEMALPAAVELVAANG